MEKWKKHPDFPGYEISSLGRVRSYKGVNQHAPLRKNPKIIKTRLGDSGYARVTLQDKHGNKIVCKNHLLVAQVFMEPARGRVVRHRNGKRSDPRLKNLVYGSFKENSDDKYIHGTHGMRTNNSNVKLSKKEFEKILKLKGKKTQKEIADQFAVSRQTVSDIHRGVTWSGMHKDQVKCRKVWEVYRETPTKKNLRLAERHAKKCLEHVVPQVRKEAGRLMRAIEKEKK